MQARIREFLRARDNARTRGDLGMIRAMNADLRRLGVPDDATLTHPSGPPVSRPAARAHEAPASKRKQRQARCEHDNLAERCEVCNPELLAAS